ncbi:MAG: hypothetical protein UR87_C0066G0006 [candidate division CPR3 bacterium GW2011_GWE2_35_7]|nr:MAG: hypothetical protein UR87_C0066G0006 [candidate division CPR3 bacterium GW2011_GWE2_35_7]
MWMIPHTLAGVTLATKIENPSISLPLALLSHSLEKNQLRCMLILLSL